MKVTLRKNWTPDEFFAWAAAQEGRYEFDRFGRATTLTAADVLQMPELSIGIPVPEFYQGVQFAGETPASLSVQCPQTITAVAAMARAARYRVPSDTRYPT